MALDDANARGIPVFNAPFSNTRSVAELIISEIVALSRQLGDRSREMHAGSWKKVATNCHEVRGRTTNRGRPTTVTVESDLVDGATRDVVASIVTMFQECLGSTPPDLSHDIAKRGITLVGGAAQLSGFDQLLTEATGVVCTVAPEPDRVVIAGLEACLGETIALRALTRRATR